MQYEEDDVSGLVWGGALHDLVHTPLEDRKAYVENFLYEDSIMMLAAQPGAGKSLLTLQMAMHMSVASPVFGVLHVPKPITTLIIQGERNPREMTERMRYLEGGTGVDYNRILISPDFQGLDLTKSADQITAINKVHRIDRILTCNGEFPERGFQVVIIDPIYSLVAEDLSKPQPATMLGRFSATLQHVFGTTNILIHHMNRGSFDKDAGKRVGADFFGSQFLQAHVTGAYTLVKSNIGTTMEKTKDSHSNLMDKLELTYDPETYMSYLPINIDGMSSKDRLLIYVRSCGSKHSEFGFNDMKKHAGMSDSRLRSLMAEEPFKSKLLISRKEGRKNYYRWNENA